MGTWRLGHKRLIYLSTFCIFKNLTNTYDVSGPLQAVYNSDPHFRFRNGSLLQGLSKSQMQPSSFPCPLCRTLS